MAELVAAIVGPGHVLVVGDGWSPIPVCLTRVWCVYEILNTIDQNCALNFAGKCLFGSVGEALALAVVLVWEGA